MDRLNPNLVLAAIVVVALVAVAAALGVFVLGGDAQTIAARAGIVGAVTAPIIVSLLALLTSLQARTTANGAAESTSGHAEQLEAAEARIAYLEALNKPAPSQRST